MILPGHADSFADEVDVAALTVDGWHLADRPGFWAAHWQEQFIDDPDLLLHTWGVTEEDVTHRLEELYASPVWPVFTVELRDGAALAVVFRNHDDDAGVDYLVLPGGGRPAIEVAGLDGHQRGPAFTWAELAGVAARQPDHIRRAQALLLLAPAFGDDTADTPEARSALSGAMRTLGASGDTSELAALAVSDEVVFWGHVPWAAGVPDLDYAPRNPAGAFALPEAVRQLVAELLVP
ncbi:hypothetical protein Q0Z83_026910 [Actinoplanes sichuanensis]|uniref:Uncharacterized protein n=1 Tax=Actinoplanes sichuanensis TaxID=512349 RepID=A0ABW4AW84_9ACTN|nr:hypothetical protein [Actinoplanes sichuanensis]BEL04500.1 hypothetical protein Q0Z83_026910 [Actinoplanes sichuanensis]